MVVLIGQTNGGKCTRRFQRVTCRGKRAQCSSHVQTLRLSKSCLRGEQVPNSHFARPKPKPPFCAGSAHWGVPSFQTTWILDNPSRRSLRCSQLQAEVVQFEVYISLGKYVSSFYRQINMFRHSIVRPEGVRRPVWPSIFQTQAEDFGFRQAEMLRLTLESSCCNQT